MHVVNFKCGTTIMVVGINYVGRHFSVNVKLVLNRQILLNMTSQLFIMCIVLYITATLYISFQTQCNFQLPD